MAGGSLEGAQCIQRRHFMHEKISLIAGDHIVCYLQQTREYRGNHTSIW
jgi:hypothetical protein